MHLLSLLLGLIFAWIILLFIGPKKCVSYYTQAPVVATPIVPDDVDKMMGAVGLSRSMSSPDTEPFSTRSPVPPPNPSVADVAAKWMEQRPDFDAVQTPDAL
jgi:hypothetical protein